MENCLAVCTLLDKIALGAFLIVRNSLTIFLLSLMIEKRTKLRALFYSFMTIAQNGDIKAQKRGLVQITYSLQRSMTLSPLEMFKIFRLRISVPVRIAAHHICGNSPIPLILNVLKRALPATALCRLQIHLGMYAVP